MDEEKRSVMIPPEMKSSLVTLLKDHVLFSLLDEQALQQLIDAIEVVQFPLGEIIINEGEEGDCAYLIYSGKVRVFKNGENGKRTTLGTLTSGDIFGEYAILRNIVRTASVRASEDTTLFQIRQADFLRLLADNPALARSLEKLTQQRSLMDFLRLHTVFSVVPVKDLLNVLDHFEERSFEAGETILAEGAGVEHVLVLREGEIRIQSTLEGLKGHLSPGSIFGDEPLLENEPSPCQYQATCRSHCLAIPGDHFHELLRQAPRLRAALLREHPEKARSSSDSSLSLPEARAPAPAEEIPIPQMGRRGKKHPWVPQHDASDCGAACLAMVARCYGARLSVGQLREQANVGRQGSTMLNLAQGAESIGFRSQAVRTDLHHLGQLHLPAIALWKGNHYIVVFESGPRRVVIGDPAIGILKLKPEEFEEGWSGQLLLLNATARLKEQEAPKSPWGRFVPFLTPFHRLLSEILLASFILEMLRLSSPVFTQLVVDKVLVHQNVSMLNLLLFGMLFLGAFQIAATVVRQYLLHHVGQKLGLALTADLLRQVLRLPMRFFHNRKIGDFLTRFEDNQRIRELLTGRVITAALDVLMILTSLGLMLYYNVQLTLVALAAFPFYIGLTLVFTPWLRRNNRKLFEQKALAESTLVESMKAIASIKDANAEVATRWKYEDQIVQQSTVEYQGRRMSLWLDGLFRSVNILANTFLLWYGAHLVIQQEMTVGQLMAFNSLVAMIAVPILGLVQLWFELQNISVALERLSDLYDAEPEQNDRQAALPLPRLKGHIRFENVSFRYNPEDRNILRNVDLDIQPGQRIALVGRSGAGKTTLAMLLQRFYSPTEGKITVDGFDLTGVDVKSLRRQLGVVAQQTTIFNGTIRENISLSDPEAPLERILEVAKQANVHEMIMSFPLGYDTVIGEMGVRLSGGQQQRLAIARALLKDPCILILDEATSALDYESERAIQQNLDALMHDRTTLIIAHRLSTVKNADRIIVMDAGQIVEEGTHSDLDAKKGLYHYLTSQQVGH